MPTNSVRSSPYGDVQLGAFREVLTYPGRYLNDHCLIRHEGLRPNTMNSRHTQSEYSRPYRRRRQRVDTCSCVYYPRANCR